MRKILTLVSLFTAINIFAHSHEEMKFTDSKSYNSEKAIVSSIEVGKTSDGDMGVKFEDFDVDLEVLNQNNIYYTKDHTLILNKINDKMSSMIIVPAFDLALYNDKYEKGVKFHNYKGALHLHINIEKEESVVEINGIDYNVYIEKDNGKTIYTEKEGRFVFTTWEDLKTGKTPTLGLLVAVNNFFEGERKESKVKAHHHDHDHEHDNHNHK